MALPFRPHRVTICRLLPSQGVRGAPEFGPGLEVRGHVIESLGEIGLSSTGAEEQSGARLLLNAEAEIGTGDLVIFAGRSYRAAGDPRRRTAIPELSYQEVNLTRVEA